MGLIASLAQSILAVAQSKFRDLRDVPIEKIVLLSVIPDYPDQGQVELSKEIWPTVSAIVHSVTIALESGAYLERFDGAAAIDGDHSFFCYCFPSRNANLERVQMRLAGPA